VSWLHIFKVKIYFLILFFLEIDCNQSYFMKLIFVEHDTIIFSLDYIVQTYFMELFFSLEVENSMLHNRNILHKLCMFFLCKY
jgi:hypothetical protein